MSNHPNGNDPHSLSNAKHSVREQEEKEAPTIRRVFQTFAQKTSAAMGTPLAFLVATLVIIVWAVTGPMFRYSNTWQLVINTGTTIVTFLMVFLIQNTQNRDAKAIQLKLDELIRSKRGARNAMVDLENCTDEELDRIENEFKRLRRKAVREPHRQHEHDDEPAESHH